ncbi:MAG: MFS transporter [Firmicutes bacterium]|nr:MFS transporter [Bacillota bacterium]
MSNKNFKKRRFLIFSIFCLLFAMSLFLRSSTAVIAHDLMESFSISASTLGLMAAVYFWIYGCVQIPVGILSDRIGIRHTVFLFGLIGVVGALLFAFASTVQVAILARIITGLGTACFWVPALKFLSVFYLPHEFASLTSVISSVANVGLVFSSYPLAFLVERTNWRLPFLLSSAVLLVLVLLAWFLMDLKADEAGQNKNNKKNEAETYNVNTGSESHSHSNIPKVSSRHKLKPAHYFSRYYKFIYFVIWSFFIYGILFAFQMLWGTAYLQDVFSISRETAGANLMFTSFGLIVGGPLWGIISDRFAKSRKPVIFWGTLGFLFTLLLFLLQSHYWGFWLVSLIYFSFGFFGIVFLITITSVKEFFPLQITGTAIGILNTIMILSVGFFQSATGHFIERFYSSGFTAARVYYKVFLIFAVCIFIAIIISLLIPETYKQSR